MPLKKVKEWSNMYNWVTHTHSHLAGKCYHQCSYCYVQKNRFGVPDRYKGDIRLIDSELEVNYGKGKTIFIEHMNDLYEDNVLDEYINKILDHCLKYPDNKYVFQTKNPKRVFLVPENSLIGTTIETDVDNIIICKSFAPFISSRLKYISYLKKCGIHTFITIEPIMQFSSNFADLIIQANPDFVNIGADSKNCNLPEPTKEEILCLIEKLENNKIKVNKKSNLNRLLK